MSMKKKISELFGIETAKGEVPVQEADEHTPALAPDYVFREDILRMLLLWFFSQRGRGYQNLYLTGPTGSGKSSVVEQFAARLGVEVLRVGCHNRMELADLVGRYTLNEFGGMEFTDGPLTAAMQRGCILLLDEVDLLPPSVAMGMNAVLDGAPLFIPETKAKVVAKPGFRIAVTGNTAGNGDSSGLHRGTVRQNLAWMDRFLVLRVGYMSEAAEIQRLKELFPSVPAAIRKGMVKVASAVRSQFAGNGEDGGELSLTLSTRTLTTWAAVAADLSGAGSANPIKAALQVALLNRAVPSEASAIEGIAFRILGDLYGAAQPDGLEASPDVEGG